ncbi:MAG: NUDIX hydrolase [Anaerolineales bacterium]
MAIEIKKSDTVFQGKVFDVRIDQIINPAGKTQRIEYVNHAGGVTIIPVDEEDQILFVRQYRHPTGEELLELPAGSIEANEDPESCARRECREEVGMSPGSLRHLGGTFLAPGYSSEFLHYYLARDLSHAPLPPDEDEVIQVIRLSWNAALQKVTQNKIRDAKTVTGIFLAGMALGKWGNEN